MLEQLLTAAVDVEVAMGEVATAKGKEEEEELQVVVTEVAAQLLPH